MGPSEQTAICCLSNLCVSTDARRTGIARKLCEQVEELAKNDWGFDALYLKVESENEAARNLYEKKLGYTVVYTLEGSAAMRLDTKLGKFVESEADTIILMKNL